MRRPSFWYLACSLIFAALAKPAVTYLPGEIEKLRSPVFVLLPVPLLTIKQCGYPLCFISAMLFVLFVASSLWPELHSTLAVKFVSLGCLLVFLFYGAMAIASLLITLEL